MSPEKFFSLIVGVLVGLFMLLIPSPIDIGETILLQIADLDLCKTDQCVQNQNNLLSTYNFAGGIIALLSFIGLFVGFRSS